MNNYAPPLQGTANSLAKYGRYGDSMLVHMNPIEVQGIAALSPTGRLTTNPVTGQQEAFLPFLVPLLGSFLGKAALGSTIGSLAAGAVGSGLATALQTGDLKKGVISGITGFGLGKILSAGSAAGEIGKGIVDSTAALDASNQAISGLLPKAVDAGSLSLKTVGDVSNITGLTEGIAGTLGEQEIGNLTNLVGEREAQKAVLDTANQAYKDLNFGKKLADPFSGGTESLSAMGKAAMSPGAFLPIAVGGGELARMEAQEALEGQMEGEDMGGEEDKARSEEEIQRAIRQRIYDYGMPSMGIKPLDSSYSPTAYANNGGLVSLNPMDYQNKRRGLARLTGEPVRMANGGSSTYRVDGEPMGGDDVTQNYNAAPSAALVQSAIRGSQLISAPEMQALSAAGYRPGFGPELNYFRTPDRFGNNPFSGDIDPRNPNAVVAPTTAQLDEEAANVASAAALAESRLANEAALKARRNRPTVDYQGYGIYPGQPGEPRGLDYSTLISSVDNSAALPATPANEITQVVNPINAEALYDERFGNTSEFDISGLQSLLTDDELLFNNSSKNFIPSTMLIEESPDRFNRFNGGGITNLAEGGLVNMQDMGQVPETPIDPAIMMQADPMQEGIAAVDPAMADPMAGIDPAALQLMEQTAMAVLGQVPPEQADAIIQAFIQQFGSEAFQMLRQQVLASVEPGAQNEGMIEGQGDGMSDEIMGSIGDQQRVAVSPGEFIVPADVVSGIGNGSSDAGAGELDRMMDEIRQARTGMTQQPPAIDPRGAMPA